MALSRSTQVMLRTKCCNFNHPAAIRAGVKENIVEATALGRTPGRARYRDYTILSMAMNSPHTLQFGASFETDSLQATGSPPVKPAGTGGNVGKAGKEGVVIGAHRSYTSQQR